MEKKQKGKEKNKEGAAWMLGMATNRVWYCWHKPQQFYKNV